MAPGELGRIELQGTGGQLPEQERAIEANPVIGPEARAVRQQPISNDQHLAPGLLAEGVEKFDDLSTSNRPGENPEVKAIGADNGDRRALVLVDVILQPDQLAAVRRVESRQIATRSTRELFRALSLSRRFPSRVVARDSCLRDRAEQLQSAHARPVQD
jgi:hypothetical protein